MRRRPLFPALVVSASILRRRRRQTVRLKPAIYWGEINFKHVLRASVRIRAARAAEATATAADAAATLAAVDAAEAAELSEKRRGRGRGRKGRRRR